MSETPDLTLFDSLTPEEDTVRLKPDIERAVGGQTASAAGMQLELVTDEHVPLPGVRREAKLKDPPEPTTWREKMVADASRIPEHVKVTPHGHDYLPTVHDGGQSKSS